MKHNDLLEKLNALSGLKAKETSVPDDMPESGVLQRDGKTLFSVETENGARAFCIDGDDHNTRINAVLYREYLMSATVKHTSDDPTRAYLDGTGSLPPNVRVGKYDYYVFAVYSPDRHKHVFEYLSAMASDSDYIADMSECVTAFCKKVDNDNDYQSAGEFALVLRENLAEEFDGVLKIGVGGVAHGVSELPQYYSYARSALVNGAEFDPSNDVYSYKEYALIKVLSELPSSTKEKYVKTVLDKNYRALVNDGELMSAADAFIKHSLNISEASRYMYVHRNTLIYRLDKIEKMTGLNIRSFNDAMTFRVAYLLTKLMQ